MTEIPNDSSIWKIHFYNTETETEYCEYFKKYPQQAHVKKGFERDVKNNPFFHSVFRRIEKLRGELEGLYRYKKSDTRITYQPDDESKTVYPIKTEKGTDASYKKKNKRKHLR